MLPFIDLKAQYQRLEPQIKQRIENVLQHGAFIMGPEVAELERALADYSGAEYAISCASGTDALLMALMAWDIGPGDAVFVPPFTFFATAEVVTLLGATPVFVDVEPVTFNMDPQQLELAIKALKAQDPAIYPLPRNYRDLTPQALIPVDLFGIAADYRKLLPIARKNGLFTLEDAAQAFGGKAHQQAVGNLGCTVAATSFFPAKPLGAYGDGGAIFTNDENLAQILKSIRVHGQGSHKYENTRIGVTGRMDTLQAAILLPKLAILDEEIQARQKVAQAYNQRLAAFPEIVTPTVPEGHVSAWAQYSILLPARDKVADRLREAGIPTNIYYPMSLHQQKAMSHLGYAAECFSVSRDLCTRILSLPMHPYLSEDDQDKICAALGRALKAGV